MSVRVMSSSMTPAQSFGAGRRRLFETLFWSVVAAERMTEARWSGPSEEGKAGGPCGGGAGSMTARPVVQLWRSWLVVDVWFELAIELRRVLLRPSILPCSSPDTISEFRRLWCERDSGRVGGCRYRLPRCGGKEWFWLRCKLLESSELDEGLV